MNHTPGPWTAKKGMDQMISEATTVVAIHIQKESWFVFSEAKNHGDAEADAKLIAAATDLLAAAVIARSSLLSSEAGYKELDEAIRKATQ